MESYPFDTQLCKSKIQPVKNSDLFVKLIGKEIIYDGPRKLMKYDLNISLEAGEVCNYFSNVMELNFEMFYNSIG